MLANYTAEKVEAALRDAGDAGAEAGAAVLRAAAPVGRTEPLSLLYRRLRLRHGALRGSVRGAAIHARDQVGYIIGPMGRGAVTRAWIAGGVRGRQRPNPWAQRAMPAAARAASAAADARLARYGRTK